jgi:hypothetical protein
MKEGNKNDVANEPDRVETICRITVPVKGQCFMFVA